MKKKRLGQWMLLAIVCLSFSVGETYAQKHEFANYKRYATENAALAQPVKKERKTNGLFLWEIPLRKDG